MLVKEYFENSELECRCGCGLMPPERAVEMLYAVRLIMDVPLIVTSAARCPDHNASVGGAPDSRHLCRGDVCGFDIVCVHPQSHPQHEGNLIRCAIEVGYRGIGYKDNWFVHLDNRQSDAVVMWGY